MATRIAVTKEDALSYVLDNCATLPDEIHAKLTEMLARVQTHNSAKTYDASKCDVENKALALLAEMEMGKVYSVADLLTFEAVQAHPDTGAPYTPGQLGALTKYLGADAHVYIERSKSKGKIMYTKIADPAPAEEAV